MTTITAPVARRGPDADAGARSFLLHGVSWDYYERTLEELQAAHSRVRVTYDDGRMEFMTLGPRHEQIKTIAARLLEMYSIEADVPITGFGSLTLRKKSLRKGTEPDECYYITSTPPGPEEESLDLTKTAPPDLAIEVDITSGSIPRQSIYAALGVPEIWRFDDDRLTPWQRQPDGTYVSRDRSLAFPDLPMDEFNRFLQMALTTSQHEAVKALQGWVRSRPRRDQSGS